MSLLQRRPASRPSGKVLTAAGRQIKLDPARPLGLKRAAWQEDAWAYRDQIGEIRYAMQYLASAASRIRVLPALAAPDGSPPTPLAEVTSEPVPAQVLAAANDALARLTGDTCSWGELLAPLAECLEVPGEALLVGYTEVESGEERWEVRSIEGLVSRDQGWYLRDTPDQRHEPKDRLSPESTYVARLWVPHPRWRGQADSPMRALAALGGPCEELQLVSRAIRAVARSRFAGAGILGMPSEIDFQSTLGVEDDPDDPGADTFMSSLTRALTTSIADEGDASSVVPIVVRAPGEIIDKIKLLRLDAPIDDKLMARGEAALRRIGAGLDVPPEIVTGLADVNHWTAWQIDSSTIKNHVEPLLVRMCDALTAGYLRPALRAVPGMGDWARRITLWYDVSPITVRPNRTEDARAGHAALVLSDEALVTALGFDPETDMPQEEELARRTALARGQVDAPLTEALMRMLVLPQLAAINRGATVPGETVEPPGVDPPGESEDEEDEASTPGPETGLQAAGQPPVVLRCYSRESRRLAGIDRAVRDQLAATATAAVDRAIERAANRVRGMAQRDPDARSIVAAVPAGDSARALGREQVTAGLGIDLVELFAGAWDAVGLAWAALTGAAVLAAVELVESMTGRTVSEQDLSRLEESSGTAWEWYAAGLARTAERGLFDVDTETGLAEDLGEDPGRPGVVTSLTRGALALAGGLPVSSPGLNEDGVPTQAGARVTGLASGDILESHLRAAGVEVLGYEWVYGISRNYFEPHRVLDGTIFETFDSAALHHTGWPGPRLAPGDHKGCHCDAQPVYADGPASLSMEAIGQATLDPAYRAFVAQMAADDISAGFLDRYPDLTSPIREVMETERITNVRPSRPESPTPITDAVRQHRS